MKRICFLGFLTIFQVKCQFLSLLKEFDMRNPVVVCTMNDLKNNKMFHLMKNIMNQNQSICLTKDIRNDTVEQSPGIVLSENESMSLYEQKGKITKPWIIVAGKFNNYSQINEPVYTLDNETLWERFQFKSFKQENALGVIEGKEFKWNNDMSRNFLERRGNFGNLTLRGMTEAYANTNIFNKDWKNVAKISNDVSDAYEVSTYLLFAGSSSSCIIILSI